MTLHKVLNSIEASLPNKSLNYRQQELSMVETWTLSMRLPRNCLFTAHLSGPWMHRLIDKTKIQISLADRQSRTRLRLTLTDSEHSNRHRPSFGSISFQGQKSEGIGSYAFVALWARLAMSWLWLGMKFWHKWFQSFRLLLLPYGRILVLSFREHHRQILDHRRFLHQLWDRSWQFMHQLWSIRCTVRWAEIQLHVSGRGNFRILKITSAIHWEKMAPTSHHT